MRTARAGLSPEQQEQICSKNATQHKNAWNGLTKKQQDQYRKKNSEQHKTTWDKLSLEKDFLLDYFIHWCDKQNFKLTRKKLNTFINQKDVTTQPATYSFKRWVDHTFPSY